MLEGTEEVLVERMRLLRRPPPCSCCWSSNFARCSSGSVSSENAVTSSTPPMMRSKCSVSSGSVSMGPRERRHLPREVARRTSAPRSSPRRASRTARRTILPGPQTSSTSHAVSLGDRAQIGAIQRDLLARRRRRPRRASERRRNGGARSTSASRQGIVSRPGSRPITAFTARALSTNEHLRELHHRRVVAVGLVRLEHRELGVVIAVDALVAEVAAELVHTLESPNEQPLQVQLERDPELHLDAERLMEGRERASVGASRHRLEHRAFELDEAAARGEPRAERGGRPPAPRGNGAASRRRSGGGSAGAAAGRDPADRATSRGAAGATSSASPSVRRRSTARPGGWFPPARWHR